MNGRWQLVCSKDRVDEHLSDSSLVMLVYQICLYFIFQKQQNPH